MKVDLKKRGGQVGGEFHEDGGTPFTLTDTGTHIEEELYEINVPRELLDDNKEYEYTGTNYEILGKILGKGGIKLTDKVTTVKSGDVVICIMSAWDDTKRTYKGTIRQILSAINESGGCNKIDSGATMTNHETGETKKMEDGGSARQNLEESRLYGGEMDNVPNPEMLQKAKELIKTESPLEVWRQTGWIYNHHDGQWRFEIDDSEAKIKFSINELMDSYKNGQYEYKLSDVLDHNKFFYLYPNAREIRFIISDTIEQPQIILAESGFINDEFTIALTINSDKYEIIRRNPKGIESLNRQTLAATTHEAQHFLQARHNFSRADGIREREERIKRILRETRNRAAVTTNQEEKDRLEERANQIERELYDLAYKEYIRQPQELEAVDAQNRLFLTSQERKEIPPYPLREYPYGFEEKGVSLLGSGGLTKSLLAPNGKPSNLTPEQWHLVRSPEFISWFGDWENDPQNASKVVDENGEPLVVYHGSKSKKKFYMFKTDSELGAHFGTESQAKSIRGEDTKIIYSLFLNIRNPIRLEDAGGFRGSQLATWLANEGIIDRSQEDDVHELEVNDKWSDASIIAQKYALDNGIDGIVYMNRREGLAESEGIMEDVFVSDESEISDDEFVLRYGQPKDSWIAFSSSQIKLADGSNTTFDSNNPDIRYAGGGNIKILSKSGTSKYLKSQFKDYQKANMPLERIREISKKVGKKAQKEWLNSPEYHAIKKRYEKDFEGESKKNPNEKVDWSGLNHYWEAQGAEEQRLINQNKYRTGTADALPIYVRAGLPPKKKGKYTESTGVQSIYGAPTGKTWKESGVSVFDAEYFGDNDFIVVDTTESDSLTIAYGESSASGRPLYLVEGEWVGIGADGEPTLDPKTINVIGQLDEKNIFNDYNSYAGFTYAGEKAEHPHKMEIESHASGGLLFDNNKLNESVQYAIELAQGERNPQKIVESIEMVRDFDLENDTLIKARYEDLKYQIKKVIPPKKIIDLENWQDLLHVRGEYSSEFFNEIYYADTEVIGRLPKLAQRIEKAINSGNISNPIILEWAKDYVSRLNKFLPLAAKFEAMKAKVGKKPVLTEEQKKQKAIQELYGKIYASLPSANKEVLSKLIDDIKVEIKPLEEEIHKRETDRYKGLINQYRTKKEEIPLKELAFNIPFYYLIFNIGKERKEYVKVKKSRTRYGTTRYYEETEVIEYISELSLKTDWKEALEKNIRFYIESLKADLLYAISSKFEKITEPIEKIQTVEILIGDKGFEGKFKFQFKNGGSFIFKTEAIWAGGYNIQKLHLRYLTDFSNVILPDGKTLSDTHLLNVISHFSTGKTMGEGGETGDFEDKYKNPIFVKDISKDEINNIISGTRQVTNGAIIQAISNYLTRTKGADSMAENPKHLKTQEAGVIKEYAISNNLWISEVDSSNYAGQGAEQDVYLFDGKTVIKTNYAIYYNSWVDYLNSLLLHNYLFPATSYELIGFTENNGYLLSVVKQPLIKTREKTDLNFVKKFLSEKGFINTKNNDYYNPELGIILEDLHDENVLTKDGILYFVDTVFYIKEKKESGGETEPINKGIKVVFPNNEEKILEVDDSITADDAQNIVKNQYPDYMYFIYKECRCIHPDHSEKHENDIQSQQTNSETMQSKNIVSDIIKFDDSLFTKIGAVPYDLSSDEISKITSFGKKDSGYGLARENSTGNIFAFKNGGGVMVRQKVDPEKYIKSLETASQYLKGNEKASVEKKLKILKTAKAYKKGGAVDEDSPEKIRDGLAKVIKEGGQFEEQKVTGKLRRAKELSSELHDSLIDEFKLSEKYERINGEETQHFYYGGIPKRKPKPHRIELKQNGKTFSTFETLTPYEGWFKGKRWQELLGTNSFSIKS